MNINLADVISAQTLSRLVHYATVVKKSPRTIIDRELNRFMDEEGDYNLQELALKSRKNQRAKRDLQPPVCISFAPGR